MLREERLPPTGTAPRLRATPLARALARAHGIDLGALGGSGPGGLVVARDVRARIISPEHRTPAPAAASDAASMPAATRFHPTNARVVEDTDSHETTGHAEPCTSAAIPVATVTLEFDAGLALARIAALGEEFARQGLPLHLGIYVAAAVVKLLPAHPRLNARWLGDALALRRRVRLAIADITPAGLRWQVIPDAGDLSLRGLARALSGLPDTSTATFALASLATGTSWWSALPLLPGTVAALILGAPERRVVVVGDGLGVRPLATLTLSYDARACDQRQATEFLETLRTYLEEGEPI
ncbi:MAG: 2-oxo acid dehydrogenase subunit E2 [Chloroflexaceae bacterium]